MLHPFNLKRANKLFQNQQSIKSQDWSEPHYKLDTKKSKAK